MAARRLTAILLSSLVLSTGVVAADIAMSVNEIEHSDGYSGSRSLGVTVSAEGEALSNVPVTIVDKNTNKPVFSGYTDSAGQVDVTLPQGTYSVIVQGQTKSVTLNKDQDIAFTLNSAERPTE